MGQIADLFGVFLKIGAFTFGGGYAMIPLIQREVVDNRHWIEREDILEITAISQSTPGPIAINAATFVGYEVGGFWGSVAATVGVTLPSFLIILALSAVLQRFSSLTPVRYAFFGIQAGVLALLVQADVQMFRMCERNALAYLFMTGAFLGVLFHVNMIAIILCCAALGIASVLLAGQKKEDREDSEGKPAGRAGRTADITQNAQAGMTPVGPPKNTKRNSRRSARIRAQQELAAQRKMPKSVTRSREQQGGLTTGSQRQKSDEPGKERR